MNPCDQVDNIRHLEEEADNHKEWRKETSAILNNINIKLAAMEERLNGKMESFDRHVRDGDAFRITLIITLIGLVATFVSGLITYGKMEQRVDIVYQHYQEK